MRKHLYVSVPVDVVQNLQTWLSRAAKPLIKFMCLHGYTSPSARSNEIPSERLLDCGLSLPGNIVEM